MSSFDDQAAISEFIRRKGATRCPTACLLPTQGSVTISDKLALGQHRQYREALRQERLRSLAAALSLHPAIAPAVGD
jgi:hypothetical protein